MRITAKVDYAIRAAAELAAAPEGQPIKGSAIASSQGIPLRFLENILRELRHAGIVKTHRGTDGGYELARAASSVNLADIIRAVEGPLAAVQGERPENLDFDGAARALPDVWIAVRANLRSVLEVVTLEDLAAGKLPVSIRKIVADPEAHKAH
jgi:Rrf2 family protein